MEENYVMAEEYFTEESQMSSEVEFENAEDYFSDENCGFKFKVNSQLLKPVKRDLELKGNTTTLKILQNAVKRIVLKSWNMYAWMPRT